MTDEGTPNSELAAPSGEQAGMVAASRNILDGDAAWSAFLTAIRPVIVGVSIAWYHRKAAGAICWECASGNDAECLHLAEAQSVLERSLRERVLPAFRGQADLTSYAADLLSSVWWFYDYNAAGRPVDGSPAGGGFRADLVQAWAILANSLSAWDAFLRVFNGHIERTAMVWCHKENPNRVCRKCKPGVEHDCDDYHDAYLYILRRIRLNALATYKGRTSLSSFVYLCLHDHRWWASLVQKDRGAVRLPKALVGEPDIVKKIYFRLAWGWDEDRIATALGLSSSFVEEMRALIEEKLKKARRKLPTATIITMLDSDKGGRGEDDDAKIDPASKKVSPEVQAAAVEYWETLSKQDRNILRLKAMGGKTAQEIAEALDLKPAEVYAAIYRMRKEMPAWFRE